jgi:hypothetical protein
MAMHQDYVQDCSHCPMFSHKVFVGLWSVPNDFASSMFGSLLLLTVFYTLLAKRSMRIDLIFSSMDRSSSDTIDRNEHFKKLVTQPIVAKYFLNYFAPFKGAGIQI